MFNDFVRFAKSSLLSIKSLSSSHKILSPTQGGYQKINGSYFRFLDVPKQISNEEILHDYLPCAKATIHETCTLVAATRVRSDQILIPTNRSYAFSKQYGDNAELKITFPADVTEQILILKVQVNVFL
jgi:hypothetical protein